MSFSHHARGPCMHSQCTQASGGCAGFLVFVNETLRMLRAALPVDPVHHRMLDHEVIGRPELFVRGGCPSFQCGGFVLIERRPRPPAPSPQAGETPSPNWDTACVCGGPLKAHAMLPSQGAGLSPVVPFPQVAPPQFATTHPALPAYGSGVPPTASSTSAALASTVPLEAYTSFRKDETGIPNNRRLASAARSPTSVQRSNAARTRPATTIAENTPGPSQPRGAPVAQASGSSPTPSPAAQDPNVQVFTVMLFPYQHPELVPRRGSYPHNEFIWTQPQFVDIARQMVKYKLVFTVSLPRVGPVWRSLGDQVLEYCARRFIVLPDRNRGSTADSPTSLPFVVMRSATKKKPRGAKNHSVHDELDFTRFTVKNLLAKAFTTPAYPLGEAEFAAHPLLRLTPRTGDLKANMLRSELWASDTPGMSDYFEIKAASEPHPCFPARVILSLPAISIAPPGCSPSAVGTNAPSVTTRAGSARDVYPHGYLSIKHLVDIAVAFDVAAPSPSGAAARTSFRASPGGHTVCGWHALKGGALPKPATPRRIPDSVQYGGRRNRTTARMSTGGRAPEAVRRARREARTAALAAPMLQPAIDAPPPSNRRRTHSPLVAVVAVNQPDLARSAPPLRSIGDAGVKAWSARVLSSLKVEEALNDTIPHIVAPNLEIAAQILLFQVEWLVERRDHPITQEDADSFASTFAARFPQDGVECRLTSLPRLLRHAAHLDLTVYTDFGASGVSIGSSPLRSMLRRCVELLVADQRYWHQVGKYFCIRKGPTGSPERENHLAVSGFIALLHMVALGRGPDPMSPFLLRYVIEGRELACILDAAFIRLIDPALYAQLTPWTEYEWGSAFPTDPSHKLNSLIFSANQDTKVFSSPPRRAELEWMERHLVAAAVFDAPDLASNDTALASFADGMHVALAPGRSLDGTFFRRCRDFLAVMCHCRLEDVNLLLRKLDFRSTLDRKAIEQQSAQSETMTDGTWDAYFEDHFADRVRRYLVVGDEAFERDSGDKLLRARLFLHTMTGTDLVPADESWSLKVFFCHTGTREAPPEGEEVPLPHPSTWTKAFVTCFAKAIPGCHSIFGFMVLCSRLVITTRPTLLHTIPPPLLISPTRSPWNIELVTSMPAANLLKMHPANGHVVTARLVLPKRTPVQCDQTDRLTASSASTSTPSVDSLSSAPRDMLMSSMLRHVHELENTLEDVDRKVEGLYCMTGTMEDLKQQVGDMHGEMAEVYSNGPSDSRSGVSSPGPQVSGSLDESRVARKGDRSWSLPVACASHCPPMRYTNIPPSRLHTQFPSINQCPERPLSEYDTSDAALAQGVFSEDVGSDRALRDHDREGGAGSPTSLHEVLETASSFESPHGRWVSPDSPGDDAARPLRGGWGSPEPQIPWDLPDDTTVGIPGMGLVRSEITQQSAGVRPRICVRFEGYSIASYDDVYVDETSAAWPSCLGTADTWPVIPHPLRLNTSSLSFPARAAYAELRRIFAFLAQAHPEEDSGWLLDRWARLTQAAQDLTSLPGYIPSEALQGVLDLGHILLPVSTSPASVVDIDDATRPRLSVVDVEDATRPRLFDLSKPRTTENANPGSLQALDLGEAQIDVGCADPSPVDTHAELLARECSSSSSTPPDVVPGNSVSLAQSGAQVEVDSSPVDDDDMADLDPPASHQTLGSTRHGQALAVSDEISFSYSSTGDGDGDEVALAPPVVARHSQDPQINHSAGQHRSPTAFITPTIWAAVWDICSRVAGTRIQATSSALPMETTGVLAREMCGDHAAGLGGPQAHAADAGGDASTPLSGDTALSPIGQNEDAVAFDEDAGTVTGIPPQRARRRTSAAVAANPDIVAFLGERYPRRIRLAAEISSRTAMQTGAGYRKNILVRLILSTFTDLGLGTHGTDVKSRAQQFQGGSINVSTQDVILGFGMRVSTFTTSRSHVELCYRLHQWMIDSQGQRDEKLFESILQSGYFAGEYVEGGSDLDSGGEGGVIVGQSSNV
ncbi:hypothetical protein OH76DRAFT_1419895 [Lentinus brumalis]|uniref:Uncharacterized protein n=1 Tax=Lentinus brumalis TaxID=2498619 RepID=A0A371D3D9_9APHY|nr:hypothetical protein OH76DRAFT_1419895 [Polyporus brumalis]